MNKIITLIIITLLFGVNTLLATGTGETVPDVQIMMTTLEMIEHDNVNPLVDNKKNELDKAINLETKEKENTGN